MTEKGPEAFRTISEVADELDLPQHVLRFWETKFSQIRPMKRSSGRRFYRPEDVVLVRAIRDMLYGQGYTIRGVQKLLKERGARGVVGEMPAPGAVEQEPADTSLPVSVSPNSSPVPVVSAMPADLVESLHAMQREIIACKQLLEDARRR